MILTGDEMKVMISAGGTGGHIYPAISIINKIKNMPTNCEKMLAKFRRWNLLANKANMPAPTQTVKD